MEAGADAAFESLIELGQAIKLINLRTSGQTL